MISRLVFAASLTALVTGCSLLPYGATDDEWAALTPQQKIELRRQWYVYSIHPPAAVLSPAYMSPVSTAGTEALFQENNRLTQQNNELTAKLADSEKKVAQLENRAKGAAKILDPDPPAPKAAPVPDPASPPKPEQPPTPAASPNPPVTVFKP